jgi:hypothetical protein
MPLRYCSSLKTLLVLACIIACLAAAPSASAAAARTTTWCECTSTPALGKEGVPADARQRVKTAVAAEQCCTVKVCKSAFARGGARFDTAGWLVAVTTTPADAAKSEKEGPADAETTKEGAKTTDFSAHVMTIKCQQCMFGSKPGMKCLNKATHTGKATEVCVAIAGCDEQCKGTGTSPLDPSAPQQTPPSTDGADTPDAKVTPECTCCTVINGKKRCGKYDVESCDGECTPAHCVNAAKDVLVLPGQMDGITARNVTATCGERALKAADGVGAEKCGRWTVPVIKMQEMCHCSANPASGIAPDPSQWPVPIVGVDKDAKAFIDVAVSGGACCTPKVCQSAFVRASAPSLQNFWLASSQTGSLQNELPVAYLGADSGLLAEGITSIT